MKRLFAGVLFACALVFPLFFQDYWLYVGIISLYYAMLASSWSMLAGQVGLISFAHVAFAGIGAYTSAFLVAQTQFPIPLAMTLGALNAAMFGLGIGALTLRMRGPYLALTTLAFSEILRIFITAEYQLTQGSIGLQVPLIFGGNKIYSYYTGLALFILTTGVLKLVLQSRVGLFLTAMREDEDGAATRGVNTVAFRLLAFVGQPPDDPAWRNGVDSCHECFWGAGVFIGGGLRGCRLAVPNGIPAHLCRMATGHFWSAGSFHPQVRSRRNTSQIILICWSSDETLPRKFWTMMLAIDRVTKNFGGLQALSEVSVSFARGEFTALVGPNGSGKTTLLNCISGLYRPNTGSIQLNGRSITGLPPHKIFHLGLGRTFQISKVFNRLTVIDNLRIPALTEGTLNRQEIRKRSLEILNQVKLGHLTHSTAENLSGGQRKLLELGMVLMTDPQILLLDEPFGGVHPELKSELEDYLCLLNRSGKTIILVSHEMPSVFKICHRLVVLDHGILLTEGSPESVRTDERVINAYLGGSHET
jgi:branched-chain amino acid transport system ATP-binding protein